MNPLDPLEMPLQGQILIEASAGTGKTHTLTTTYLRLLLESGPLDRGLSVDRILVVTFTEAATQELRGRIRSRITQALEALRNDIPAEASGADRGACAHAASGPAAQAAAQTAGQTAPQTPARVASDDSDLASLLGHLTDRAAARTALEDALTCLDEAAIFTIHGFCQRMLQENAFESRAPFEAEFITDESALRRTAAADFWRRHVGEASGAQIALIRHHWKTPQELLAALSPRLALDDVRILPDLDAAAVERTRAALARAVDRWRGLWRERGAEAAALLRDSPALNRRSYTKTVVERVVALAARLERQDISLHVLSESEMKDFARLSQDTLDSATKARQTAPEHPIFAVSREMLELFARLQREVPALFLCQARAFIRQAVAQRKRDDRVLYFDDLLRRLDHALQGPGGHELAATIRNRFPAALIDEFQDTDPQQYRIFRAVYQGQEACALFLIGDPKQAIYSFRGADVFTYMQARADTADASIFTLRTNWRSSARLVSAVNALFDIPAPFLHDAIPFVATTPGNRAETRPLRIGGEELVPLQFWMLEARENNQDRNKAGVIRKAAAHQEAARACARHIALLLNQAAAGEATLGERPLRSADIAVLVRTHREGDVMQQALRDCGVRSVTLSQRSVFATEDAEELAMVLQAVAEPGDEGRVRAALATALLGRSAAELELLAHDELAWEAVLDRFQEYSCRWRQRGFMVAFQELLVQEEIGARLLRRMDGERRLTNLLQLSELLQAASTEHAGMDGLLRWLEEQRGGDEIPDELQLRLESEEGLVQVVTMHKSKGLEYPVVFIPFPWSYSGAERRGAAIFFHDPEDGTACLDLGTEQQDQHRALAAREELAERLRLLYVSITRAARLCVLCWGRIRDAEHSAPAYLLHGRASVPVEGAGGSAATSRPPMADLAVAAVRADLEALATGADGCIAVRDLPDPGEVRWTGAAAGSAALRAAVFAGSVDDSWRVTSYSGLVRGQEAERPDHDAAVAESVAGAEDHGAADDSTSGDPVFDLPAGTRTGLFLHQVFQELDFPRARGAELRAVILRLLGAHGLVAGSPAAANGTAADWPAVVELLVGRVLDTVLRPSLGAGAAAPTAGLRLRDLARRDRLDELEFHFSLERLDAASLRAVLARNTAYSATAAHLDFASRRGLMRGFIDLVCRHEGRYYLIDYKSNLLGRQVTAYAEAGLRQAIQVHRYDLQYLIYTVALHRFLRRRHPDYSYDRDFGGVYYLFLRGMHPAAGRGQGVWYDRPEAELVADLDRLFGGGGEVTS